MSCVKCQGKHQVQLVLRCDIEAIPVCYECKGQVQRDLLAAYVHKELDLKWFKEKYNLKGKNI